MTITTPETAVRARETNQAQREAIRLGYIINDYPYQPDRTYIVFEATAGINKLHIATGATGNYFINAGNGKSKLPFNDTGGTKDLTYDAAGRYLITIEGNFNGILLGSDFGAVPQGERDKYIGITMGSNYPTAIVSNALSNAANMEHVCGDGVTSIQLGAMQNCTSLKELCMPNLTSIAGSGLIGCNKLQKIEVGSLTTLGNDALGSCTKLIEFKMTYNALLTVGINTFSAVKMMDLIMYGANSTEANAVDAAFVASSMGKRNGYRLIY